jgi:hypothetical protein
MEKIKIENTVRGCGTGCRYFTEFHSVRDNFTTAYVCIRHAGYENLVAVEQNRDKCNYPFPEFCPLPDYDRKPDDDIPEAEAE